MSHFTPKRQKSKQNRVSSRRRKPSRGDGRFAGFPKLHHEFPSPVNGLALEVVAEAGSACAHSVAEHLQSGREQENLHRWASGSFCRKKASVLSCGCPCLVQRQFDRPIAEQAARRVSVAEIEDMARMVRSKAQRSLENLNQI
jgi:hypothetical protein